MEPSNMLWGLSTDFELSTAGWQTFLLPRYPPSLVDFEWETSNPGTGTRSIVLRPGFGVNSFPFSVKPETVYTFSILARADRPGKLVLLTGVNPRVWEEDVEAFEISIDTEWKRVYVSFQTPSDVSSGLFLLLENQADPEQAKNVYVDAFTVCEGSLAEYNPGPYQLDLTTGVFGNFFPINQEVTVRATLRIHDSAAISTTGWNWTLNEVAPTERTLLEESIEWRARGDGSFEAEIVVPAGQGMYRVVALHDADDRLMPCQELLLTQAEFAGLPAIPDDPEHSFFGIHLMNTWMDIDRPPHFMNLHSNYKAFLARLHHFGARWIRLHGGHPDPTKMYAAFPEGPDEIRTHVAEIQKLRAAGFGVVGLLQPGFNDREAGDPWFDSRETRGAWMGDTIPSDLSVWEQYVKETVSAYRSEIKTWEIYNEPNGQMTSADYIPLLKRGYEAAKEADPEATVLGICTTTDFCTEGGSFVEECLAQQCGNSLDVLSFHPYVGIQSPESGGVQDIMQNMVELRNRYAPGKALWNSEVGWPTVATYASHVQRGSENHCVTALEAAAYTVRNLLLAFRMGLDRYFMYDGICPVFGFRNSGFSPLFEYDGTPNASYLAVGTAIRLLHNAQYETALELSEGVYAYLFRKSEVSVLAAVWVDNQVEKNPLGLEVTETPAQAWDGAGRPVDASAGPVQVGMMPTWLTWQGITVADVGDLLKTSTLKEQARLSVAARVDLRDGADIVLSAANPDSETRLLKWKPLNGSPSAIRVGPESNTEIARLKLAANTALKLDGDVQKGVAEAIPVSLSSRFLSTSPILPKNMTVDGGLTEWTTPPLIEFSELREVTIGDAEVDHWMRYPAQVWIAADDEALVLAGSVSKEKRGWFQTNPGVAQYNQDSVELFLRLLPCEVNWIDPVYQRGDVKLSLGQDSRNASSRYVHIDKGSDCVNGDLIEFAFANLEFGQGYTFEARMPWRAFPLLKGTKPPMLGFDISLNLSEEGNARTMQYTWSGDSDNWVRTNSFGMLRIT
ncbi:MAG: hypothetical protein HN341_14280 [Verrucomicrobia bacterium]|jgi:hypothetical protein|nr:hypothetical protein [Verrucomicrobiota bacterium]